MSLNRKTSNNKEWDLISHSLSEQRNNDKKQQEILFKFFIALLQKDKQKIENILDAGLSIDLPLSIGEDNSVKGANKFFPEGYPFYRINAVSWAAFNDDVDVLELLYEFGADFSFPGPTGRDALSISIIPNAINAWEFIKEKLLTDEFDARLNWSLKTSDGKRTTRLMDAVNYKNLTAVTDIVGNVDLGVTDYLGKTALHYNLLQDPYTDVDLQIGRLLIDYGAPIRAEDNDAVAPIAMIYSPEQKALVDKAILMEVTEDAYENAHAQREHLNAQKTHKLDTESSEPDFPQIQKPVKFKKPLF